MSSQENLRETIVTLIRRRAEGTYWDFKRCHHDENYELIHDVLCLANANHRGDRFLIFGVNNEDFSLHSVTCGHRRRTQASIADLFRNHASKFFQSRLPEFWLQEITLDGTFLDVLVIKDMPHKPYYLVQRIQELRAHHIYTRVSDTNTPKPDAAQPHEIERMWRERFGLALSPLEKVQLYLDDPRSWRPVAEAP